MNPSSSSDHAEPSKFSPSPPSSPSSSAGSSLTKSSGREPSPEWRSSSSAQATPFSPAAGPILTKETSLRSRPARKQSPAESTQRDSYLLSRAPSAPALALSPPAKPSISTPFIPST